MKVLRYNGSYRYKAQRRKQILKTTLAIALSLAVVCAAFFAVYAVSRSVAEKQSDAGLVSELKDDATTAMTMPQGEVCMLTLPEGVDVLDVQFTSSNAKIARVDPAGKVDGLNEGTATITATDGEFSAACEFRIEAAKKEQPAEITTAYITNQDILNENIGKSKNNLYHLVVNRRTNTVTAYTYSEDGSYDVPVRAMVCSCGTGGADITPVGEFRTASMRRWATLYGDAEHEFLYGQYVTEFNGDILFHSVPYEAESKDTLETAEFNKLGTNASQGCVRLAASDSYWIYKNCPLNTPVSVIDADGSADPLGTPPAVKQNYRDGWDPTDPDGGNPLKGKLPRILGVKEPVTLERGAVFDPMEGVVAKDLCANVITDRVNVTGQVLTQKPGTYYITYSVTDDFHLSRTWTRTVVVK